MKYMKRLCFWLCAVIILSIAACATSCCGKQNEASKTEKILTPKAEVIRYNRKEITTWVEEYEGKKYLCVFAQGVNNFDIEVVPLN